ncbi:MAG TPA: DNA polymerase I, partial [Acetobacteraceae bacterium]|nr:DNA polymerase I [Acetobacteraceae bacterium]
MTDHGENAPAVARPAEKPHLVLVDGSGFIFRAFHALPPMTRPDGTPVNAVFGFTNMLAKLLREHVGTHLAVIFDAGRATFRTRMYDQYKAQRPEPPPELVPQFALVREATAAFNVPAIELADWEADDLIAAYARAAVEKGGQVTIVSSDKDLMQLIRPGVMMLDPIKQKPIGPAEVMERFGVPPEKVVEVQSLMGDSVDNVPGVPGIGPKTACQLITEYGTLEKVLEAAPGMKASKRRDALIAHAEAARLSRKLVELSDQAPLPLPLTDLPVRQPDRARLATWLHTQGFRSIVTRLGLESHAAAEEETPAAPAAGPPAAIAYGPYETVTTEAALDTWIEACRATGFAALRPLTDGNPRPLRAALIGFALASGPGRACYVPLAHRLALGDLVERANGDQAAAPMLPVATALARLAPLLTDPSVLKLFHSAKHDLLALGAAGAPDATPLDDVMLISYAQEAGAHGHGLEELATLHLGHTPTTLESVTGTGRARLAVADLAPEAATRVAAEAADVSLRLWRVLRPRLRETQSLALYEQMERRLIPVLAAMERAGIKVDAAELRRMSADFGARMATMEAEIHRLAGHPFSVGSPKQLGEVLFDEMSLPGGKRGANGAWGTDANVLQTLAEQGHDLPARVLEWRQLAKLKSTYADALVEEINPATGRVHTSFAMAATSTGRLSSNDPNLQNIPVRTEEGQRIRRAFVAEPGNLLVSADYSQIELRLLAHVANIPALREAFAHGEDIHARTASEVFGIPMAQMDPVTRRRAKAINFGIIYGISAFGLGRQLQIDPGEARRYIDAYFARYPGIRDYMERTKEEARAQGYVLTPFGRRCWIPGIADRVPARRAGAERQAINAPLQGGAADIIKRAMVRLPAALAEAGLRAQLLLQVHDELLFEAPEAEAATLAELARRVMEGAATLSVPLV